MNRRAFSLVELLSVIAILGILSALVAPALSGVLAGRNLAGAADRMWSAASMARAEALARQANVAMIVTLGRAQMDAVTDAAEAVILMVAQPAGNGASGEWTWAPGTPWRHLPDKIEVSPVTAGSFLHSSDATPPAAAYAGIGEALPLLRGQSVDEFYYVIFRPDGSILAGSSSPALGFRRLNSRVTTPESALVLSPESGRARMVDL